MAEADTVEDKDINDVFSDILFSEEQVIKQGYEEGYEKGVKEGNTDGYHLGYHRGAEIGAELGYYLSIAEHLLDNPEKLLSKKAEDNLRNLVKLINEFPKTNVEHIDIFTEIDKIRCIFKKVCAMLKINAFYQEIDKLSF